MSGTDDAGEAAHPRPSVSYEEVKGLVERQEGVIVDVRDRDEVQQEGKIPSSRLLPRMSLQMSSASGMLE